MQLVERGWPAAIPLIPREKRPAISGWEKYNTTMVTLEQADRWARQFPGHGIGHAAGHGLVGIDLDTDKKKQANTAKEIADRCLGPTPMISVGRAPRTMRYYRLSDYTNSRIVSKSFYLFALYATTGQTAWHGIHPGTGKQYEWIAASPMDIGPGDLPTVTDKGIQSFVDELTAAFPETMNDDKCSRRHLSSTNLSSGGVTTSIMSEMGLSPHTPPIKIALKWISSAAVGTRHHTMVGAVTALVHVGFGDQEIFDAIFDTHVKSLVGDRSDAQTRQVVQNAITWARDRVGISLDVLNNDLHVSDWSIWP